MVARLLGVLTLAIGLSMVFTLLWATGLGEDEAREAVLLSMGISLGLGLALSALGRGSEQDLLRKESLGVVALGWIVAATLGALPFYLAGVFESPVDAFFESMSGFTTTGSSVLTDIEAVPRSLLFWRNFTQWLGGIGIIVLFIAILPQMGVGGRHLFRSEIPGAVKEGMSPRIKDTALYLLAVYLVLTLAEFVILMSCGMTAFDSVCHTMGTVSTGGFSTRNASVAAYDSTAITVVITVFMILGGTNFGLYFLLVRGRARQVWRDLEFRAHVGVFAAVSVAIAADLILAGIPGGTVGAGASDLARVGEAVEHAAFQAASIQTTTGFATRDFDAWPAFSRYALLILMFVGGSSGSTAGGIKMMRILVLSKVAYFAVYHWFRPHAVVAMRMGGVKVKEETIQGILGFFVLFMGLFVGCSLIMSLLGLDLVTATSSVVAALGNIGPGLGLVGPVLNYADVPAAGKLVLSFCMLLGRLELFTVMVLLVPSFWRR
jgi:trk system potassium uptake protein TrkH